MSCRFEFNCVSYFYFIFNYDSFLNIVSFKKNCLISYLCLNIVHFLMLFHVLINYVMWCRILFLYFYLSYFIHRVIFVFYLSYFYRIFIVIFLLFSYFYLSYFHLLYFIYRVIFIFVFYLSFFLSFFLSIGLKVHFFKLKIQPKWPRMRSTGAATIKAHHIMAQACF